MFRICNLGPANSSKSGCRRRGDVLISNNSNNESDEVMLTTTTTGAAVLPFAARAHVSDLQNCSSVQCDAVCSSRLRLVAETTLKFEQSRETCFLYGS
jgi:mRNA-degrading endonuclease toxin of MazEF toxin-antitoxin module